MYTFMCEHYLERKEKGKKEKERKLQQPQCMYTNMHANTHNRPRGSSWEPYIERGRRVGLNSALDGDVGGSGDIMTGGEGPTC